MPQHIRLCAFLINNSEKLSCVIRPLYWVWLVNERHDGKSDVMEIMYTPVSVLVLRFPLFVTCSKVLHTGLRVAVRSQCGSLWMLNVQQTVQVVATQTAWLNAHFAAATGCRVILQRLRFSLRCLFEELPAW